MLPVHNNRIYAKVLQLDRLPKPRPSRLRRKIPHVVTAGAAERNVGTTSWRREQEAQRRMNQARKNGCFRAAVWPVVDGLVMLLYSGSVRRFCLQRTFELIVSTFYGPRFLSNRPLMYHGTSNSHSSACGNKTRTS